MSASAEIMLNEALGNARGARMGVKEAQKIERERTVYFADLALKAGWSWNQIGKGLGITGNAARRYYERNRRIVRPG